MSTAKVTLKTVAGHAGVSMKSVSRVINNEPNVSKALRDRVTRSIAALEFKPNLAARQLRGQRSYTVALVYEPPSSEFLTSILEGVLSVTRAAGYSLLLEPLAADETRAAIRTMLERRVVDGIILLPPLCEDADLIREITAAGVAVVLIASVLDLDAEGISAAQIGIDDFSAGREVGERLIALGHTRFGYIRLRDAHRAGNRRGEGLRAAMAAAGLPPENLMIEAGNSSFESGQSAGRALLSRADPPTAIFAANDYMAAGLLSVTAELGLSVPEDISVCGFDGADLSRMYAPSFMSVEQPLGQYGKTAAENLLASMRADYTPQAQELPYRIIDRPSIGPAPV